MSIFNFLGKYLFGEEKYKYKQCEYIKDDRDKDYGQGQKQPRASVKTAYSLWTIKNEETVKKQERVKKQDQSDLYCLLSGNALKLRRR